MARLTTSLLLSFAFKSLLLLIVFLNSVQALEQNAFHTSRIENIASFSKNLLRDVNTSDSITEGKAIARAGDDSVYIVGHIIALSEDTNEQSFALDESGDSLGDVDIFVLKAVQNGTVIWSKRMGSRGTDRVYDAISDNTGNLYIAGTVGRTLSESRAGAFVVKYDNNGSRTWARTYGSISSRDVFTSLTTNFDGTEILVTGKAGSNSPLRTNITAQNSDILVGRINATNGEMIKLAFAQPPSGSKGAELNSILLKETATGPRVFVAGRSKRDSGTNAIDNCLIFSFSYPRFEVPLTAEFATQTNDNIQALAGSNNEFSVYSIGSTYVSIYEEFNIKVQRVDAEDLKSGWSETIGSKRFENQASIITGAVSEFGRDIVIDEFGNLLVLADASGSITGDAEQEALTQRRPALLIFGANGTLSQTIQANGTGLRAAERMVVVDNQLFVCGSILNTTTSIMQIYLSTVSMSELAKSAISAEETGSAASTPPAATETSIPSEAPEETEARGVSIALIAGVAGGAAALVVVVVVVALSVRSRLGRGAGHVA